MKHNNVRESEIAKSLGIRQGALETGWTRTLEENLVQLQAEIQGLEDRISVGMRSGVPAAFAAQRIFLPEQSTVLVDIAQQNAPAVPPVPMNYIVRDGVTYDIPVVIPGPGVFVAKYLTLAVYLRYFDENRSRYVERNVSGNQSYFSELLPTPLSVLFTTKFSNQSGAFFNPLASNRTSGSYPALNYFWNLLDSKSGVRLGDELMSQNVLLQRSRPYDVGIGGPQYGDGGYFEFDVPFVFERDGQANFLFRPITPFLQTSDTANPQSVIVQVELHGFRYETDQDAMQMGALSR